MSRRVELLTVLKERKNKDNAVEFNISDLCEPMGYSRGSSHAIKVLLEKLEIDNKINIIQIGGRTEEGNKKYIVKINKEESTLENKYKGVVLEGLNELTEQESGLVSVSPQEISKMFKKEMYFNEVNIRNAIAGISKWLRRLEDEGKIKIVDTPKRTGSENWSNYLIQLLNKKPEISKSNEVLVANRCNDIKDTKGKTSNIAETDIDILFKDIEELITERLHILHETVKEHEAEAKFQRDRSQRLIAKTVELREHIYRIR